MSRPKLSTMEQRITEYLSDREKVDRVSRSTLDHNRASLNMLSYYFGEDRSPETITPAEMKMWLRERLHNDIALSTCRLNRATFARFFDWLGVDPNPARLLEIKGPRSQKKTGWSRDQIEKLRKAADELDAEGSYEIPVRYTFELALATGVREGELFALEGVHLNPTANTCRVVQQAMIYPGTAMEPTKSRDTRVTFVLPEFWKHHRPGVRGLLISINGEPVRRGRNREIIDRIIHRAGIKVTGERTHMTRHTYSRLFLEEYNGDLRDLQKFLGHESLRTTEQYYGHYSTDVAIERANERVYGKVRNLRIG